MKARFRIQWVIEEMFLINVVVSHEIIPLNDAAIFMKYAIEISEINSISEAQLKRYIIISPTDYNA